MRPKSDDSAVVNLARHRKPLTSCIGMSSYEYWLVRAECELAIENVKMEDLAYDWEPAFKRGLEPHEATTEALDQQQ